MCADLRFSLDPVGIQPILTEELTVVLQLSPEVSCVLPQLQQHKQVQALFHTGREAAASHWDKHQMYREGCWSTWFPDCSQKVVKYEPAQQSALRASNMASTLLRHGPLPPES